MVFTAKSALTRTIVELWNQQSKIRKLLNTKKAELFTKAKDTIQGLSGKQINELLEQKCIRPITSAIDAMPGSVLLELRNSVEALNSKYATTYNDIEQSISKSNNALANLLGQLTGDETTLRGLQGFH